MVKRVVSVLGAAGLGLLLTAVPAQARSFHTIWVHPGTGTISAAVAAASPGDTLRLKAGLYRDSVTVEKTLTIIGSGTTTQLVPPAKFVANDCNTPPSAGNPAQEEGICVLGAFDSKGNPNLARRVKNVHVSNLYVHGFS